jgi:hypothetical protein
MHDTIIAALADRRFFPTVLAVLDVCAALRYAQCGGFAEWRMVVYWLAAAALTSVVTW